MPVQRTTKIVCLFSLFMLIVLNIYYALSNYKMATIPLGSFYTAQLNGEGMISQVASLPSGVRSVGQAVGETCIKSTTAVFQAFYLDTAMNGEQYPVIKLMVNNDSAGPEKKWLPGIIYETQSGITKYAVGVSGQCYIHPCY